MTRKKESTRHARAFADKIESLFRPFFFSSSSFTSFPPPPLQPHPHNKQDTVRDGPGGVYTNTPGKGIFGKQKEGVRCV